jgi:hypothetical protein
VVRLRKVKLAQCRLVGQPTDILLGEKLDAPSPGCDAWNERRYDRPLGRLCPKPWCSVLVEPAVRTRHFGPRPQSRYRYNLAVNIDAGFSPALAAGRWGFVLEAGHSFRAMNKHRSSPCGRPPRPIEHRRSREASLWMPPPSHWQVSFALESVEGLLACGAGSMVCTNHPRTNRGPIWSADLRLGVSAAFRVPPPAVR